MGPRFEPTHLCCAIVIASAVVSGLACGPRSGLPSAIGDREFSELIETLSEPAGAFTLSDNLVSNEPRIAENIRWLSATGGVYIGVGPEQNFSYISRLRPELAFIVDIRRENRNLHFLYKALFDLSSDRADFVSRLFSRPRPGNLGTGGSAQEIFSRYGTIAPSAEQLRATTGLVRDRLAGRGFPLTETDLDWINRTLQTFHDKGPEIHFWSSRATDVDAVRPSYRQLMTARDINGQTRSYLSSEDAFRFVKGLQSNNLIVPVVGDFAGPTAIRRVGEYVRVRKDVVQAFYGSNVGVYLTSVQMRAFCGNLAALPVAPGAAFIESNGVRAFETRLSACSDEAK